MFNQINQNIEFPNYGGQSFFDGQAQSLYVSLLLVPTPEAKAEFSKTSIELVDDNFRETTDLGVFSFPISISCIRL